MRHMRENKRGGIANMTILSAVPETAIAQIKQDPSLMLALGTGSLLSAFLFAAHACCIGLTDQHLTALLQICRTAG
jgi:hypothetical protein